MIIFKKGNVLGELPYSIVRVLPALRVPQPQLEEHLGGQDHGPSVRSIWKDVGAGR